MNTTEFRNIHVSPSVPSVSSAVNSLPRLRLVTNDPFREYAARPGEVERLPDAAAALILCKKSWEKVQRNGIKIELDGRKYRYWSEGSITCTTKADTNEKVLCVVNRQNPDVLHILTPCGKYVETIPLDGKAAWFDYDALAKIHGAKARANNRRMERIARLHAPDAQAAIDREDHNATQLHGMVQTFPVRNRTGHSPLRGETASPNALTNHRSQKSVPHPQVQRESAETKRFEKGGVNGVQVGEQFSRAEFDDDRSIAGEVGGSHMTVPCSARDSFASPASDRSAARSAFPAADRLHEIQQSVAQQRKTRACETAAIAREPGSLADLLDDDNDDASLSTSQRLNPPTSDADGSLAEFI